MMKNWQEFYRIEKDFHDELALHIPIPNAIDIGYWERPLWQYIESIIGDVSGKRILDVGCGFGREAILFALGGAIVHGIDLSEKSILRASELAERLRVSATFQVDNIDLIEYGEEYFDVIFCRATLHHLPDPVETLKRLCHFVRVGGLMIAQEPRSENPIAQVGRKFFNPSTATEHPFREGELETIFGKVFDTVNVKYFFVSTPLCFTFEKIPILQNVKLSNLLFACLHKIDGALFRGPLLKKYAWIEIIHGVKRESGQ